MARIGERQHEAADLGLLQGGQDVFERHVGSRAAIRNCPSTRAGARGRAECCSSAWLMVATTCSTNADEFGDRLILVGDVALEREVGRIDLQQEPVLDDRLVLDLQRLAERREIVRKRVVMLVAHRHGENAGRRRAHERLDEDAADFLSSTALKWRHSSLIARSSR